MSPFVSRCFGLAEMQRREFLAIVTMMATAARSRGKTNQKPLLLLSADEAHAIGEAIRAKDPRYGGDVTELRSLAEGTLDKGPWSVTSSRPKGIEVPANEYYSEGPYWWPDPKNPNGPYIRKDGERNPGRFDGNHHDIGAMSSSVLSLGMAAYFFGDDRYATHAQKILSTWFLEPATRMNPNLEYGQAVRGINTGRGTGLIDTVALIHATQGIVLLEQAGKLDELLKTGLRQWYSEFLKWMTTSEKGLDEKKSGNNHATWWTAQVAAYSTFVNDAAAQKMAWNHYRTVLVPGQIQPDGSCPREEARTNSLSYSTFNLDAFSVLCRIAELNGVDLWKFHTPEGIGVDKALAYVTPYVQQPDKWKKQQITPFAKNGIIFPAWAGLGFGSADLMRLYRALPRAKSPWVVFADLTVLAHPA
jgi:Alginate lyase